MSSIGPGSSELMSALDHVNNQGKRQRAACCVRTTKLKRLPFNGDIYVFVKWHELEIRGVLDLYSIQCRSDMIPRATNLRRSHN
jgi:hypothetical protein